LALAPDTLPPATFALAPDFPLPLLTFPEGSAPCQSSKRSYTSEQKEQKMEQNEQEMELEH
jgi:hypothetical protein